MKASVNRSGKKFTPFVRAKGDHQPRRASALLAVRLWNLAQRQQTFCHAVYYVLAPIAGIEKTDIHLYGGKLVENLKYL